KNCKLFSKLLTLIIFCVVLSVVFSGCGLSTIIESRKEKNFTPTDVISNVESIDETPTLSDDEYEYLDSLAQSLYYAKFQSEDDLSDGVVLQYISSILHDQELKQNYYLVTPEKTNIEFKLDVESCKKIAKALFDYDLSEKFALGEDFVFPISGGSVPVVAGRDTYPLEDGSFSIIYRINANGGNEEYKQVTLNVIRQNSEYSKFHILSIVSVDG
ncbi:MAG: hypothetical protein IKT35_03030, partial [Clostridia bacterium]|nr:hypothetical protein [Clostridia bacterium]